MGEFSKRAVVPTYPIDALDKNCENVFMFLREKSRTKDGKTHRYWSVVENRRVAGGGVVQLDKIELGGCEGRGGGVVGIVRVESPGTGHILERTFAVKP